MVGNSRVSTKMDSETDSVNSSCKTCTVFDGLINVAIIRIYTKESGEITRLRGKVTTNLPVGLFTRGNSAKIFVMEKDCINCT